jgi:hypothetical protein
MMLWALWEDSTLRSEQVPAGRHLAWYLIDGAR